MTSARLFAARAKFCLAPLFFALFLFSSESFGQDGTIRVDRELCDDSVREKLDPDVWSGSFSIAARFALIAPGSEKGNGDSLGMVFNVETGWHNGFRLVYDWRDGRLFFQIGREGGATTARSERSYLPGVTREAVVVYDREGQKTTLYVDGAEAGSAPFDGTPIIGDGTLNVGFGNSGVGSNRMRVETVSYWRKALTADEVAQLYEARPEEERAAAKTVDALGALNLMDPLVVSLDVDPAAYETVLKLDLPDETRRVVERACLAHAKRTFEKIGDPFEELPKYSAYATAVFAEASRLIEERAARDSNAEESPEEISRFGTVLSQLDSIVQGATSRATRSRDPQNVSSSGASRRERLAQAREATEKYGALAREAQQAAKDLQAADATAANVFAKIKKFDPQIENVRRLERESLSMRLQLTSFKPTNKNSNFIYVAPTGSDAGAGTASAPFATLARALEEAERVYQKDAKKRVVVELAPGVYRTDRTARATGVSGLIIRATRGDAVFTGARRLKNFERATEAAKSRAEVAAAVERLPESAREKTFVSDLAAAGIKDVGRLANRGYNSNIKVNPIPSLYVDGKAQTLARWPNDDEPRVKFGESVETPNAPEKSSTFKYDFDRVDGWKLSGDAEKDDIWAFGLYQWEWAADLRRVLAIDRDAKTVTFDYENGSGKYDYYFVNVLEELDSPGEYYVDRDAKLLYFYPSEDLSDAEALNGAFAEYDEFSERFLEFENVSDALVAGVAFSGGRESGVFMKNCDRCFFDGCTFAQLGGNAAIITGGTYCGIVNSRLRSLGSSGVHIDAGDRATLTPCHHIMSNCYVSDFSRIDRVYAPALTAYGCGISATNNLVCDSPHHAFRTDGNDIYLARNEIHSVVYEYSDQSGLDVYCDPTFRGIVVERNLWRHIGSSFALCGQAGIRLDDSISGVVMKDNVFYRCSGGMFGGIQIHGGKDNLAIGNVFIDCLYAFSFSPWRNQRYEEFVKERFPQYVDSENYVKNYPFFDEIHEHIDRNYIINNTAINCDHFNRGAGIDLNVFVGNARRGDGTTPIDEDAMARADYNTLRRQLEALSGISLKDVGLKPDWNGAGEAVTPRFFDSQR